MQGMYVHAYVCIAAGLPHDTNNAVLMRASLFFGVDEGMCSCCMFTRHESILQHIVITTTSKLTRTHTTAQSLQQLLNL